MPPNTDRHRIDLDLSRSWRFDLEAGLKGDLYLGHHVGANITCLVWAVMEGQMAHWILIANIVAIRKELRLPTETSDEEAAEAFAQQVRPEMVGWHQVLWRFPNGRSLESAPTWVDGEPWTYQVTREALRALGLRSAIEGPPYPSLTVSCALLRFWERNSGSVHVTRGGFGTGLGPYFDRSS